MDVEAATLIVGYTMAMAQIIKAKKKANSKIRKKRLWSRKWLLERESGNSQGFFCLQELQLEDPKEFCKFCRMSPAVFNILLKNVEPLIKKEDTFMRKAIPASHRYREKIANLF